MLENDSPGMDKANVEKNDLSQNINRGSVKLIV